MDESCPDRDVTTYFFDTCALLAIAMMQRGQIDEVIVVAPRGLPIAPQLVNEHIKGRVRIS